MVWRSWSLDGGAFQTSPNRVGGEGRCKRNFWISTIATISPISRTESHPNSSSYCNSSCPCLDSSVIDIECPIQRVGPPISGLHLFFMRRTDMRRALPPYDSTKVTIIDMKIGSSSFCHTTSIIGGFSRAINIFSAHLPWPHLLDLNPEFETVETSQGESPRHFPCYPGTWKYRRNFTLSYIIRHDLETNSSQLPRTSHPSKPSRRALCVCVCVCLEGSMVPWRASSSIQSLGLLLQSRWRISQIIAQYSLPGIFARM